MNTDSIKKTLLDPSFSFGLDGVIRDLAERKEKLTKEIDRAYADLVKLKESSQDSLGLELQYEELSGKLTEIITDLDKRITDATSQMVIKTREVAILTGYNQRFLSRAYLSRLFVSILIFLVCAAINSLSSTACGWRTPRVQYLDLYGNVAKEIRSLPDVGHDLTEYIVRKLARRPVDMVEIDRLRIPDMFLFSSFVFTLIFCFFHPRKLTIIRRFFLVSGLVNLMRAFTVIATSLPDPTPSCQLEFVDEQLGAYKFTPLFPNFVYRTIQRMLITPGKPIDCGDVVFSGHTLFIVLCWKVFAQYAKPGTATIHGQGGFNSPGYKTRDRLSTFLRSVYAVFAITGLFVIVASKFHYTLDVFIGAVLSREAWKIYHVYAEHAAVRNYDFFIRWMEAEEIEQLEMEAYQDVIDIAKKQVLAKKIN